MFLASTERRSPEVMQTGCGCASARSGERKFMAKLAGKVAVITGGNSGMGLETARLFVKEGATVVITGRRQKELDEAVSSIGGNVHGFVSDISNLDDMKRLHDFVKERFGRADIVFANAGGGLLGPFGTITEQDFDK